MTADCSCITKYFWENSYRRLKPHLYASVGTFGNQIGQFFEESESLKYVWKSTKCIKRSVKMWTTSFYKNFSKNFCCTWTVGCQIFIQYIHMLCPGGFILVECVSLKFYFMEWRTYIRVREICQLLYRCLLILHYCSALARQISQL